MDSFEILASKVKAGYKPKTIDEWLLADEEGWTAAHWYVTANRTGSTFPEQLWAAADHTGWTVAHQAAQSNTLPPMFNMAHWALVDHHGESVLHIAVRNGTVPKKWLSKSRLLRLYGGVNHAGKTVWDEYLEHGEKAIAQLKTLLRK